tara:strand:- start:119 stop:475 length:357 start_codon:yes stop_codon:yes gene_type:complete
MSVDTCIGLNERALELVEDAEVVNPEGGGSYPTIWTGDWPLASYVTEDGTVYQEFLQEDIWTPEGPVYFLALLDEDEEPVTESLWSDEEMDPHILGTDDYDPLFDLDFDEEDTEEDPE